jgi:hypothetical protein
MDITNIIRLLDIFLIGPVNIIFSLTLIPNWILLIPVFLNGAITIIYNYINFNVYYRHTEPYIYRIVPVNIRKYIWDPINGKTQLIRLVNLFIQYPLLIFAVIHSQPGDNFLYQWSVYLMILFIVCGIVYNLWYFLQIKYFNNNKK